MYGDIIRCLIIMLTIISTKTDVVSSVIDIAKIKHVRCFHTIPETKHRDYLFYVPTLEVYIMILPYDPYDNVEILANGEGWIDPEVVRVFKDVNGIKDYLIELARPDMIPEVVQSLKSMWKNN